MMSVSRRFADSRDVMVFQTAVAILDWTGVIVFAISGALVPLEKSGGQPRSPLTALANATQSPNQNLAVGDGAQMALACPISVQRD